MLTYEENKQYSRHLSLPNVGVDGQLRLKNAKVLVVGAGGLGSPILQYLTAAGVGAIGIVDGDQVSQSNLQRQVLYSVEDIGKLKAATAKEKLERLNPFINIQIYSVFLSLENAMPIVSDYDIVVDATDNFASRYLINDVCVMADVPFVYGAIFQFEGQISVFNYRESGTYRCLFPNPPNVDNVLNCSEAGVLGVLPGVIGCLQANEVIKMIIGKGEVLANKLLIYNLLTMNQTVLAYQKTSEANVTRLQNH